MSVNTELQAPLTNYEAENLLKKCVAGRISVLPTRARNEFSGKCGHGCGIVNLDRSTGPGTHFTLWMNLPDMPHVYYFDSFGVVPPAEVEKWLKTSSKPIAYSSEQVQAIDSSYCGYFCAYIAAKTLESTFLEALMSFDKDPAKNQIMLEKYFSHDNIQ